LLEAVERAVEEADGVWALLVKEADRLLTVHPFL